MTIVVEREWFETVRDNPKKLRNSLIMHLLFDTGMRTKELVTMKVEDIDLEYRRVTIVDSKKHKRFTLPVSSRTCDLLAEYLKGLNGSGWLFPSSYKKGRHIISRNIQFLVKKTAVRNGLPYDFCPRWFRYRISRYWIRSGGKLTDIQKILRHRRISTTSRCIDKIEFADEEQRFQAEYSRIMED